MSSMEEEAQRRAADLRRKESEVSALHSFDSRGIDPLAHLKEQFAELMDDLHGSENDPEMAAVRPSAPQRLLCPVCVGMST
jgi:hypothetical protein